MLHLVGLPHLDRDLCKAIARNFTKPRPALRIAMKQAHIYSYTVATEADYVPIASPYDTAIESGYEAIARAEK